MSLRAFHMIFITITTIFCLAVALWSLLIYAKSTDLPVQIMGWVCVVATVLLPIYGASFYKKSKSEELTN